MNEENPGAGCCAPAGRAVFTGTSDKPLPEPALADAGQGRHRIEQAIVPALTFGMGDSQGDENRGDGETPVHQVTLESFSIDATSVTNNDFARFVEATGYRTEAEAWGFSAVFHLAVAAPEEDIMGFPAGTPWWRGVKGADWRHPGGRHSGIDGLGDHPVVHVSWNDAGAYCQWAGRALPTEAQWEAASRGGLDGARFPWGDDPHGDASFPLPTTKPRAGESWRMNIWQGTFPAQNTCQDGFLTTAPVRSFEPNAYGLWQTIGNVWEWCADWWSPGYYRISPATDPRGPDSGQVRVMRGGSYLCHDSYCNRYRNSARSSNTPDSSMGNAGFRTVGRTVGAHPGE
ncbi:formylglycine-generating enzyme family protein [Arthrobacter nitrophenolicus]|uniref:Formylglycine-generating enzyme family protein n=1 Tax=Arthrobacter nitrophenolicus TaxID=683150 RepID=A0A4V3B1K2_9MICC|nr:formylglycine-generating enzyme family protein [Arthrobacter nitrophenolicus]TDL37278.1 formylglycine-generating enzyme family protein [Arthrobacter nitrophenolicus]